MTLLELISPPSLLLNKPLLILIPLVVEIPTPSPTVCGIRYWFTVLSEYLIYLYFANIGGILF